MNENNNTQFETYLDRIEALERKERRKKILYGFFAFLVIGSITIGILWWRSGEAALMTYGYKELDTDLVQQLIADGDSPFVVYYSELGRDTIYSEEDFGLFVSMVELMDQNREIERTTFFPEEGGEEFPLVEDDPEDERLPVFFVDIEGERESGAELTMKVEDYNSSVAYTIFTGNGDRIRIRGTATYTYQYGGNYLLKLYASKKGFRTSVYTKRMIIEGAPPPANPDAEALALNSPTSSSAPEGDFSTAADSQKQDSSREILLASASNEVIPLGDQDFDFEDQAELSSPPQEEIDTSGPETPANSTIDFNKPMFTADNMPAYPGGNRAMARYFRKNFRYPSAAREAEVDGQVFVRFIVQKDGSLSDVTIFRGLGYGCDEEALRLVKAMPRWEPGIFQGREVAVYKEIPITFRLVK